jgi:YHS domain-containing protein
MKKDPVCGMQVDEEKAAVKLEYEGEMYYFCSKGCREKFEKDPEKFQEEE